MSEPFGFGPAWARNTTCCGKPVGCTNMSGQCRMLNHPWKRWHRETYGPPDPVLGAECPACGDTYHDLPRHLALNLKGCADEMPESPEATPR